MSEHASQVASRFIAHNACADRAELTSASFTALNSIRELQTLGMALQDPTSAASTCVAGNFMAAEAELWVGNNLTPTSPVAAVPTTRSLVEMYDWFVTNNVRVINESWGVSRTSRTNQSVVVDYYARKHGMNIVQAAGNLRNGDNQSSVRCKGFNSICVGSLQPKPGQPTDVNAWVGANGPDGWELGLSPGQDTPSPLPLIDGLTTKPDLMSSGVSTDVAAYLVSPVDSRPNDLPYRVIPGLTRSMSIDLWKQESGSSFAAPVVSAAIALHGEQCGGVPPPHVIKARMKTAMAFHTVSSLETASSRIVSGDWTRPLCRLPQPTPTFPTTRQCDFRGGVGGIFAGALRARGGNDYSGCAETSICSRGGGNDPPRPLSDDYTPFDLDPTINLTDAQRDVVTDGETTEVVRVLELGEANGGMEIPTSLMPNDPRLAGRVGTSVIGGGGPRSAPAGFWIRSTFSYYSCPPETPAAIVLRENESPGTTHDLGAARSDLTVAVDFDLALVAKVSASDPDFILLAVSAAPTEVTEGLQYRTTQGFEVVDLWATAPSGARPCDASFNPGGRPGEPTATATRFVVY